MKSRIMRLVRYLESTGGTKKHKIFWVEKLKKRCHW
jgi:hypothetical protein